MNLVVNLYIVLLHCCTMLLNFLLIYAVKLCLIILVVNLYIVLVHLCTVHAKSVMNYACVMFCPCPPPIFKIYISEIQSSFYVMLSEMKMIGD